jgi:Ras-related protein Rab-2A
MSSYSYLFKFIIVGDSNVGKSCLMLRFTDNKFKTDNDPTIGVEFGSRSITVSQKLIKLQIWDTAGQENFRSITRSYFRGAIGCVLTYDVTNRDTFQNLANWIEETQTCSNSGIVIILVGNKCDLTAVREVDREEVEEFSRKRGLVHIETSAKTGANVDKVFESLSDMILEHIRQGLINPELGGGITMGISELNEKKNGGSGVGLSNKDGTKEKKNCAC